MKKLLRLFFAAMKGKLSLQSRKCKFYSGDCYEEKMSIALWFVVPLLCVPQSMCLRFVYTKVHLWDEYTTKLVALSHTGLEGI